MSARAMEIGRLYKGRLEVVSPLHVGSGDFEERKGVNGKSGQDGNDRPQVATIARDGDGKPFIPGTTLKGLLRRLLASEKDADLVAGSIKADKDEGQIGFVQVRGARLAKAGDTTHLPYAHVLDKAEVGEGVFVAARTAIDDVTGSVEDGKLFFQEMVAPGAKFDFELMVAPRRFAEVDAVCKALDQALAQLATGSGTQIGKGQADGFGRIKLDAQSLTTASGLLDATTGGLTWTSPRRVSLGDLERREVTSFTVKFSCPGPFIIADSSRKKERVSGESDDERKKTPHARPQRLGEDLPLILGSSVSGALRNRAEWLARVKKIGADFKQITIADRRHMPAHPVDRLFGVTGFRGLLGIRGLDVARARPWEVTSVKLDRFSGAPVDNALFTTETFIGVEFTATFEIDSRGYPEGIRGGTADPGERKRIEAATEQLIATLKADLATNGLQLGAGGNKGFGWFTATIVEGKNNG
ncbi:RAMP superfamily CRISPR-associated protein [Pleomorphomonas sp. NRK KF1]|uniref:RAMP superfamily CRISPR-associated protein n=1 Tax=Pleomorphomonas sp. NRK KF1 TaxID=2943000 RepID=UPI002044197A|nr:RAMP superfamily CRISPR-associated protein [Pleomorphomonas sp. NRK KF1]MCM5552398.1 RAMP superfamily CRISPR-associated protein [Pleomorphomonas sp. NRK KF1]